MSWNKQTQYTNNCLFLWHPHFFLYLCFMIKRDTLFLLSNRLTLTLTSPLYDSWRLTVVIERMSAWRKLWPTNEYLLVTDINKLNINPTHTDTKVKWKTTLVTPPDTLVPNISFISGKNLLTETFQKLRNEKTDVWRDSEISGRWSC